MQSFCGRIRFIAKNAINCPRRSLDSSSSRVCSSQANGQLLFSPLLTKSYGSSRELPASCKITGMPSVASPYRESKPGFFLGSQILTNRGITTSNVSQNSDPENASATPAEILDREAVEEVRTHREIPDIRPGYIIQLRLEVPENKRRVSTVKGIVIARRNAGLNTTIRLRRMVAGVGIESLLPLYSPNVKEIQILDKKKVRRAKLYYLRDKMNALKK
ncbi:putative ribosomal protein L19 [Helianthus annuus]|uniref:Ribosomal protein L19 n=1 Tax=Helianthus annuus TaxID=4232 RepID=A0A9K3DQ57_HELAN|nr:putative ribosomal protein L19 [Helianthus annuus]